jgi:hypothetical protein
MVLAPPWPQIEQMSVASRASWAALRQGRPVRPLLRGGMFASLEMRKAPADGQGFRMGLG